MLYRTIGNTGLVTSIYGFGFWATFGVKEGLVAREGIDAAKAILKVAREGGINLFDHAEAYGNPNGEAERLFGEAYKELKEENATLWRRSDIILTTKIFWGGSGYNEKGLSKKHVMEGLDNCLERLQVDYVDLVYCHRPDSLTPTETVVRAMTDCIRSGKATAWGTSEWSAQQITEAYWIAKTEGLYPPQVEQPEYNMFNRDRIEKEYVPIYNYPYRIGLTTWSPLASGLLTGKYNDDALPEGSRATQKGYTWIQNMIARWKKEGRMEKVKQLQSYAKEALDCTVTELALAWPIKQNPSVSCVLLGATKVEQIEANLKALAVVEKLTDKHMEEIEAILGNKPGSFWGNGARNIPTI